jgi:hypothetical protein
MLAIAGISAQASGSVSAALPGGGGHAFGSIMASSSKTGEAGKGGKAGARAAREARLAAALRENLKRRKQQARQRAGVHKSPAAETSGQDQEKAPEPATGASDFRRNRSGQ